MIFIAFIKFFLLPFLFFYFCYLAVTFINIPTEKYKRHRELLKHPENDILGDTSTSISMVGGKLKIKKRASDGATKRLFGEY